MKKKICALFAVPMVLVALSSCNKTVTEFGSTEGETGTLKLNISFASTGLTKAEGSGIAETMRPTSAWSDISSLMLVVCNSSNTVVARTEFDSADIADIVDNNTSGVYSVTNVPVGSGYIVYAIANYTTDETSAWTYGYGGLPTGSFTLPQTNTSATGYLDIDTYDIYNDTSTGYIVPEENVLFTDYNNYPNVYSAAPNYFVGSSSATEVTAVTPGTATVQLRRPVNLVRVKVKLSDANVDSAGDPLITFGTTGSSMVLRRVNTQYEYVSGSYSFADNVNPEYNVSFAPGPFTALPLAKAPDGYVESYWAEDDDEYTWYKDMLAFPPTDYGTELANKREEFSDPNPDQLNLVLYGVVANGKTYIDQGGATVQAGTVVSFTSDVDLSTADRNGLIYSGNAIITLYVDLASAGRTGGELPVSSQGTMNVTVSVSDWSSVFEADVEI